MERHLWDRLLSKAVTKSHSYLPQKFPSYCSFHLFPIVRSPTFLFGFRNSFLHFFCNISSQNILQWTSSTIPLMKSHYSVELSKTLNHAHLLISPCLCCQHNAVVVSFLKKTCMPGFFAFPSHLFEKRAIAKMQPDVGSVWGTILSWLRQNSTLSQLACRVRGKWFNLVWITRL